MLGKFMTRKDESIDFSDVLGSAAHDLKKLFVLVNIIYRKFGTKFSRAQLILYRALGLRSL
jgi:hypothetical protein